MKGRPLRFLGTVLGGWAAARVIVLWPGAAPLPGLVQALAPPVGAAVAPGVPVPVGDSRVRPPQLLASRGIEVIAPTVAVSAAARPAARLMPADLPLAPRAAAQAATLPPPLAPTPFAAAPGRLSGSAWLIARGGRNDALANGQLGGSQAGVRLVYSLGDARRVALAGRVSAPFAGRGAEAAVGVEWRPLDIPLRLIAEQRIPLDGGRGGPTLLGVAGLPPTAIAGLSLEAYAQAGAIARGRVEGFADGAARLTRQATGGTLRLDLGLGAWGGAQRGAARLDVGPTIGVGLPVGDQRVRVTLDWRTRIAGGARPGSGPALSIGSDF